jgi:hypothetical protein
MPGFVAGTKLQGIYGDRYARLIILKRRKKQPYARAAVIAAEDGMISVFIGYEICRSRVGGSIWNLSVGACVVRGAKVCM